MDKEFLKNFYKKIFTPPFYTKCSLVFRVDLFFSDLFLDRTNYGPNYYNYECLLYKSVLANYLVNE